MLIDQTSTLIRLKKANKKHLYIYTGAEKKVYLFHLFHSKSETFIMYTFIPHRLIYFKCLFILILMIISDN